MKLEKLASFPIPQTTPPHPLEGFSNLLNCLFLFIHLNKGVPTPFKTLRHRELWIFLFHLSKLDLNFFLLNALILSIFYLFTFFSFHCSQQFLVLLIIKVFRLPSEDLIVICRFLLLWLLFFFHSQGNISAVTVRISKFFIGKMHQVNISRRVFHFFFQNLLPFAICGEFLFLLNGFLSPNFLENG